MQQRLLQQRRQSPALQHNRDTVKKMQHAASKVYVKFPVSHEVSGQFLSREKGSRGCFEPTGSSSRTGNGCGGVA